MDVDKPPRRRFTRKDAPPVPVETPIADFALPDALSEAVHEHRPQFVEHAGREHAALLGQEDLLRLLAPFEFSTRAARGEDGRWHIWLDDFAVYGLGDSFEAAVEDLLDEVREYIEDFFAHAREYLRSPKGPEVWPLVLKAAVADHRGNLRQALLAPPREEREALVALGGHPDHITA